MNRLCHYKLLFLLSVCFILIIVIFQLSECLCYESSESGIIVVKKLNLRSGPGQNHKLSGMLEKGDKIEILKHEGKWLKILYGKQIGYIRNRTQYVHIIPAGDIRKNTGEEERKKKSEIISQKIKKNNSGQRLEEKEITVLNSLNKVDLSLNKAGKFVSSLKTELAALEKKITKTADKSKDLAKKFKIKKKYASKRLIALYKLGRLGKIHVLASAGSICELFQRKRALERILAYDENILNNLAAVRAELHTLTNGLNIQKKERIVLEEKLEKQIIIMSRERAKRSKLLDDIHNKKSIKIAVIESLIEAANFLDQTVEDLGMEFNRNISRPPGKKKMLKEIFPEYKGLLKMPVKGKIINFYGTYKNRKFNIVNFRGGIDIKAERGEPIRAVCSGKVLYSEWFKGYGNLIIIDHGDNYYTLYAHAEELFTARGDTVELGEVVATVGDTGTIIGPNLHFEIRHHGKPVNPLLWIKTEKKG